MFGFFPFAAGTFADVGVVSTPIIVDVTGTSATGYVATVAIVVDANVLVVGVQANGYVTRPLLWGPIIDTQYPDWQNIDDGQAPVWAQINDNQTPAWTLISDTQSGGWAPITDKPPTDWQNIPT